MKTVKETVRVGVVGMGHRGDGTMLTCAAIPGVKVVAICDVLADRVEYGKKVLKDETGQEADGYTDHREMLKRGDLDAVLVVTSWQTHIKIAVDAMRAGVYAAM